MKKTILITFLSILLVACSNNDNQENTENENLNNEERTGEENEESERELIIEETDNDQNHSFRTMLGEFLVDSYQETSVSDFRHTDKILSEDILEIMYEEQQTAEVHFDESDRNIENFELYYSDENPNHYIYIITLEIDNQQTEHYGEVMTQEENNTERIVEMNEISVNQ